MELNNDFSRLDITINNYVLNIALPVKTIIYTIYDLQKCPK